MYRVGAICGTLSNNRIALSIWRDDHLPVHMVSNCQNSSIILAPCTRVEKLNTRVVNHTCAQVKNLEFILTAIFVTNYRPKI